MPSPRKRLGDILVEADLITQAQLEQMLERQRGDPRRLGVLLVEAGFLSAQRLSQMLSYQLGLPWVSLADATIERDVLDLLPRRLALLHHFVPVYLQTREDSPTTLYVATDDPTHEEALAECARAVGIAVRPVVAAPDDLDRALAKHYRGSSPAISSVEIEPTGAVKAAATVRPPPMPPAPVTPPALDEVDLDDVELLLDDDEALPVLVINPQRPLLRRCRIAAAALGARVVKTDLGQAREQARKLRPFAIVVDETLYALDRVAFNKLALESGSPLVIWSDDLDAEFLEPVLATARLRARV